MSKPLLAGMRDALNAVNAAAAERDAVAERDRAPAYVVLWHFADTGKFTVLWLGDDRATADRIAAQPATALEPGHTVVRALTSVPCEGG